MNTATSQYDESLDQIASMLRMVGRRLTEVAEATLHANAPEAFADGAGGIGKVAAEVEQAALRQPAASSMEAVRMASDLRRMDASVELLAERVVALRSAIALGDEISDLLTRMFDLTLALIGETQDAVSGRDPDRAKRAAEMEAELDEWYDLLLAEMFEDIVEGSATPSTAHEVAVVAKLLERVGGRAVEVAENASRLLVTQVEA